jgi:hypothetical protein
LNFDHAQRRRLRRVLGFVWDLSFVIWVLFGRDELSRVELEFEI